jgi:hypothetical protein
LKSYLDSEKTADEELRACSAELHCARPEAASSTSGLCDVHRVIGFVCHHNITLKGMFVGMFGPEQFVYY